MAETIATLQRVLAFPDGLHWFCPRQGVDDSRVFYPEDRPASKTAEAEAVDDEISAADQRKAAVFDAAQVFAYEGGDAAPYQESLEQGLAKQLANCDVCIREYHRGRRGLKQKLEDGYDEDEVASFLGKFDGINLRRIQKGLNLATKQLRESPPEARSWKKLDQSALYAIFEALNCAPAYKDEEFMGQHFDEPFALVQTKRPLRMGNYTPAMTSFLFSAAASRVQWANNGWDKLNRNVTAPEFEWSVQEPLITAMMRVQLMDLDQMFLPQFWAGTSKIVSKLDQDMITHSLRAMDLDVCRLALDHLQVDSDGLKDLLATVHRILVISPKDFWEAMGTIPPVGWLDQFFASPALARLLKDAKYEKLDSPVLASLFSWVMPFLNSIKPINQPSASRSLVDRLLGYVESDDISATIKMYCSQLALKVLGETFRNLNYDTGLSGAGAGAASWDVFETMEKNISTIMSHAKRGSALVNEASETIRQSIALDCKSLASGLEALLASKSNASAVKVSCHATVWRHVAKSIESGNIPLARCVLLAIRGLVGIERAPSRTGASVPLALVLVNAYETFEQMNRFSVDFIERVNDFSSEELQTLFRDTETMNAVALLCLSSDNGVRIASMELFKTMSTQSTRKDAVDYVLRSAMAPTLDAFSFAFRRIAFRRIFTPCPALLKCASDLLEALCDSQDGLLRSQALSPRDVKSAENFWQALWQALTTIFQMTESWSNVGHDKQKLMEFCRDTMGFAETTFDQFGVFAGVLDQQNEESTKTSTISGSRLIELPKAAMSFIVKWLRLRDDFLLTKSSALVSKLLVRLKDLDIEIGEEPLVIIEGILSGTTKSKLRDQQKAEIERAVETHIGHSLDIGKSSKSGALTKAGGALKTSYIDLDTWAANAKSAAPNRASIGVERAASDSSRLADALHAQKFARSLPKSQTQLGRLSVPASIDPTEFKRKREKERQDRIKRDQEIVAANRRKNGVTGKEGSGVQGLGVLGVEHTAPAKGTGMMVSSDSESEDEEDIDLDRELFGEEHKPKASSRQNGFTEEQAAALRKARPTRPVKKQRLVRSARDMRARLAPDLAPLHKVLLSWDYFHSGAYPPKSSTEDYASVLNTFRDALTYQETFQPLLILEAWNGFMKAREENTNRPYEIAIANRSSVDAFIEMSSSMPYANGKEIGEGDIVLLSKSNNPASASDQPHCLSRVWRITRKKGHLEVIYRVLPGMPLGPSLTPSTTIYGVKITSVIPLEREYGSLLGLQYYDLCEEITQAKPSPLLNYTDERLHPFMRNYDVNKAQAKAVKSAIDNDAFTLVQGPPGSGKTKTIVAIVGALLSDTLANGSATVVQPRPQFPAARGAVPAKKMLVCAPSNAAVDELVMRFKDGVKTLSGRHSRVNILRLGRSDAMNVNVQDVTLDELVSKKLNSNPVQGDARAETQKIMNEHKEVSEKLREIRVRVDEAEAKGGMSKELKESFGALRRQKTMLGQKVDSAKEGEAAQNRQTEQNRRKAQQEVVDDSHVICATLSGSGHDMFQSLNVEFETVIIDEAAQCVELSALIPLKYGCAKCILVGDPQQLPPTVFSKDAQRFKYEQSLFVRMQANHPRDIHLLDTQYRMHPDISAFPSAAFYDGRLLDGKDMAKIRTRPWHATALLGPFRFFDVQGQHQAAPKGHSLINIAEINIAVMLYRRLTTDFDSYDFKGKIGIITPYKSQLKELRDRFRAQFGAGITDDVEFNTTDAFQGREAEVIIFSCVRASPGRGIGFLSDIRRMNVGLTRAKSSLWVLGNSQSLAKGEYWGKLVDDAKSRARYTTGDLEAMLRAPSKLVRKLDAPVSPVHSAAVPVKTEHTLPARAIAPADPHSMMDLDDDLAKPLKRDVLPTAALEDVSNGPRIKKRSRSPSSSSASSASMDSDTPMPDAPRPAKRLATPSLPPTARPAKAEPHVPTSAAKTEPHIHKSATALPPTKPERPRAPLPAALRKKEASVLLKRKKPPVQR